MILYVVQHTHQIDKDDDIKLLGIYSSRDAAELAVERAKQRPGLRDAPDGFSIDGYVLDQDCWTEGYVTR
jgi:hypothetical protein